MTTIFRMEFEYETSNEKLTSDAENTEGPCVRVNAHALDAEPYKKCNLIAY